MQFPRIPQAPTPKPRPPTVAPLEARRGAAARLDSLSGKVHTIMGFFDLINAGEALIDVNFPVWFLQRPLVHFGAEMAEGQVLTAGAYPTISLVVHRWTMKDYPNNVSYFAGATLVAVSTGVDDQRLIVHWSATGVALRNPGGETLTVDGAI